MPTDPRQASASICRQSPMRKGEGMSDLSLYNYSDVIEWFGFLDRMRKKGTVNMMGAAPYLVTEFGLATDRSREVLTLWMKSFDPKIKVERRARVVYMANGGKI